MADQTSVLVNISDMIDLAIGTPEVGVVDFNMLQTVLHCLAQQLRILGKNVELRGSVAALPVASGSARDNVQTIAISEYVVDLDDANGPPKKIEVFEKSSQEPDTILVVERVKKSDSMTSSPARAPSPSQRGPSAPTTRPATAPASGPAKVSSTEKLSLVTISKFNILEDKVEDLKNRVYGSMPKNEAILEEVRSQTNLKAITDMWTSLNVSSRLEAAEAGLAKLSSLVQDLISETTALQDAMKKRGDAKATEPGSAAAAASTAGGLGGAAGGPGAASGSTGTGTGGPGAAPGGTGAASGGQGAAASGAAGQAGSGQPLATKDELAAMMAHLERLRDDLNHLSNTFYDAMRELNTKVDPPPQQPVLPPLTPIAEATTGPQAAPSSLSQSLHASSVYGTGGKRYSTTPAGIVEKVDHLEKQLQICCESIDSKTGKVQDQINALQDQLEYLVQLHHQNVSSSGHSQDLGSAKLSPDLIKDLQGLMRLFQTVQDMQDQLHQVHETALQLAAEKEDRQHHVDALLEQIELLKTVKLDREDMAEAMADKADLRALARKVSHDQFEMACDDLSRGLEHALGKLNMQEALWQQALDDIQREIETKLDKMELSPVKDFFNNKLKQLQENLKQMAMLRREAEAAGTKRKLLRDVNCISCDAKAVMNTEATSAIPMSKPLPAQLSMKPYLSYELDAIRKSQANNLPQRNMHDWETIDRQMTQHKPPQKVRSDTDRHLCNRYCGGSHTVTTPAQRVARLGHFIKQWGPDVLPLSSGFAAGDDGRMYRVSPTEGVSVGPGGAVEATCTPKSPKKKESKQVERSTIISNECRCLEGEYPGKPNH